MRYIRNPRTKRGDKFLTSRILRFPPTSLDKYIISREGDRLDLISNNVYGKMDFWWVIAIANNLGKGTLNVPAGLQLRLPNLPISIRSAIEDNNQIR
tara:strand:- start:222 stop:512 length:291 start_codon:yes stop_codon:yes gene_type:complete